MKAIYLAIAMLMLSACTMVEERMMQTAVDNAEKIAKFADLYCEEVDEAKRLELRVAIADLRGGKEVAITC